MNPTWKTIPQMVAEQARRYGLKRVLRARGEGPYADLAWGELARQMEMAALGLMELGFEKGDRAAILSENRPEWAVADLAVLSAGGVTVPIYTTLAAADIEQILSDSGAKVIFVSTPELLAKVLTLEGASRLKIILFDAPYRVSGPRIWWLGELIGLGKTAGDSARKLWGERLAQGAETDLASIIYTSGTTGRPKGAMLTHGNFLSNCAAVHEVLPINERDETLSFLPLSHVFERTAGYYFVLWVGGMVTYARSLESVPEELLHYRPTILTAVPRFYEKVYERIQEKVRSGSPLQRKVFAWAVRVGRHPLADLLVWRRVREAFGGRLRFCISGSAPLDKALAEFFRSAGILILEGYGLTETSPVITVNRPGQVRFGTVGLPIPGVEVKTAPDGEILTRGPHVMRGYFNNPQATAEAIDPEGWFHTGDIGAIDAQGFLAITDRKKDMLKTSGGKLVAPQKIEARLKADPWIADGVVVGDRRKFLAALVVPERSRVEGFAKEQGLETGGLEALLKNPKIHQRIWERVELVNRGLASFEQIKKIALLTEPFTIASGELTPTLKVKRKVIAERYAQTIEAMYRE
ncbi:MAG: long-chain fatty acid--CoA ligase [Candidatus Omnitrophica bacterium]|nr:long-chain fatty acid--CoA ligase [Candidatus Omnitrophota bacterium]